MNFVISKRDLSKSFTFTAKIRFITKRNHMKNTTTKTLLLTCLCMMLFTAITHAQCAAGLLAQEELKAGKKVILAEVYKDENGEATHLDQIGKTLTVGKLGLVNIGDCWFMGDLNINGEDVFFVGVTLKAAQGETYDGPVLAAETKAASDFPVGAKVIVYGIPSANPSSTAMFSDRPTPIEQDKGEVVEADLKKNANGTYDGCILDKYGWDIGFRKKVCFTGKKVELIK